MDSSELIRNVTLCGHLHHGKVGTEKPKLIHAQWFVFRIKVGLNCQ